MKDEILKWPELQLSDTYGFFAILFVLILILVFVRLYYTRKLKRESSWYAIRSFGVRRGLREDEIAVLRLFFRNLDQDSAMGISTSRRQFHSRLQDYFKTRGEGDLEESRMRVRILDKLFPQMEYRLEVKSVQDLQIGEICSIEFNSEHHLAHIMRRRWNRALLSLPDWNASPDARNSPAALYVYRPGTGGFLMRGQIREAGAGGVIFEFTGQIEESGEKHLMALLELPLILTSWPPPELARAEMEELPAESPEDREGDEIPPPADLEGIPGELLEPVEEKPKQLVFHGRTDRVSDRGLLFSVDVEERALFRRSLRSARELWQIDLILPGGFRFLCRGRVMPLPGREYRYIFKYLDAPENSRRVLFSVIKEHGGEREQLI